MPVSHHLESKEFLLKLLPKTTKLLIHHFKDIPSCPITPCPLQPSWNPFSSGRCSEPSFLQPFESVTSTEVLQPSWACWPLTSRSVPYILLRHSKRMAILWAGNQKKPGINLTIKPDLLVHCFYKHILGRTTFKFIVLVKKDCLLMPILL